MKVKCYFCKEVMEGTPQPEPGMVWACSECCDNHGIDEQTIEAFRPEAGRDD